MNKLYKYLPFDITLIGTGVGYGNNTRLPILGTLKGIHYLRNDHSYKGTVVHLLEIGIDACNSFSYKLNDVKPFLRPLKDVDKELPLTKIAAEIVNQKEGDLVIPIYYFIRCLFGYSSLKLDLSKDIKTGSDSWFTYYDIPAIYTMYNSDRIIKINYTIRVSNTTINPSVIINDGESTYLDYSVFDNNLDFEKGFDFLRAMHFSLDFNSDEFIPMIIED